MNMSIVSAGQAISTTETDFRSFSTFWLKPILQFVTAECIASMPTSGVNIVDFIMQLLESNKERLYEMCGVGKRYPQMTRERSDGLHAQLGGGSLSPAGAGRVVALSPGGAPRPVMPAADQRDKLRPPSEDDLRAAGREVESHSERVRELESQIRALEARIRDSAAQRAAAGSSLSQTSLDVAPIQVGTSTSLVGASACVLKCSAAVAAGFMRRDAKFLREVFDRHKDGPNSLSVSKLTAALTEADAPVNPDSDAAAAATIARFDSNSNGVMEFGEFERAVNVPDELALYFQEKRQPALADALRALVGRGSDQLLRVSQLTPEDMLAACTAVCAILPEQAKSLHEELQRSFVAQFEIQSQMAADGGKFNVVKMACGGVEDFHSGLTGRVGMPNLKFMEAMRQEHCERAGWDTSFTTGNYKITTTPKQEWLYIAGDETGKQVACPASQMEHGRRILAVSEAKKLKLAVDAKLTDAELLTLIMYTGPMFQVCDKRARICACVCVCWFAR